ncbi:MAG: GNAT family N-acetyltransferase [Nitrosomonadales bacterium]|jgi:RimJ/RimL family protein N-acetyltransferase|nr:GNAT family N-acetyltransferase [Candidatus Neomarinimicrobiota bacterium]MBT6250410.1 GNAT family N-acetyltransferase [Nitrosomonadales bacterium]
MYVLESERLGLRNLELDDNKELFKILSDQETMQFYPKPYTLEETENWIHKSMKSYQENGFGLWAVILKKGEHFIGQCGITLQNIDGENVPEIGYHINKNYWKRGFASEGSKKCLKHGFIDLGLKEIFIHTFVKNIPSMRVAEKVGMKKRKEYDKEVGQSKKIWRHVIYSLKRNEY